MTLQGVLINTNEAAERLRCPKMWIKILRKAGFFICCPGVKSLIITGAMVKLMQAREGVATEHADLLRIYDRDGVAERLGVTPQEVSRRRLLGHIGYIPVRPILYREADILNYLSSQERHDRDKLEGEKRRREWAAAKPERDKKRAEAAERKKVREEAKILRPPVPRPRPQPLQEPGPIYAPRPGEIVPALTFRRAKNGFWYAYWSAHGRSMRKSLMTKDCRLASQTLKAWQRAGVPWT